jgi:phosphatidylglycerophosphatase C
VTAHPSGAAPQDTGPATVLFDLDGVLTRRDTFGTLVRRRLLRTPWKLLLALPALAVHPVTTRHPELRGAVNRYLVRVALLTAHPQDVRDEASTLGREFAARPQWLLRDGIARAQKHVARGDQVVVATATEATLARALLDHVGLQDACLFASELQPARLGLRLDPHNYGARKLTSLRAAGTPEPWSLMYSDSLADLPVLLQADEAVVIGAPGALRRRLRRHAREDHLTFESWR